MTPSQAESPSAPEAIEDQRSRGGPWGTVSLIGDTLAFDVACSQVAHRSPPTTGDARAEGRSWGRSALPKGAATHDHVAGHGTMSPLH